MTLGQHTKYVAANLRHEVAKRCSLWLWLDAPTLNGDEAISIDREGLFQEARMRGKVLVLVWAVAGLVPFTQAQKALALLTLGLSALSCCVSLLQAVGALLVLVVALSAWGSFALSRPRLKRLPPRYEGLASWSAEPFSISLEDGRHVHRAALLSQRVEFSHRLFVEGGLIVLIGLYHCRWLPFAKRCSGPTSSVAIQ